MNAESFEKQSEGRWQELEGILDRLDRGQAGGEDTKRLPLLFRQVCGDLALAQARMYSLRLCERINRLVLRGYRHLHRDLVGWREHVAEFFWRRFPRLVREEWRLCWLVMAFFWIPFGAMVFSSYHDTRWMESLLGPQQMAQLQQGFGEGEGFEALRDNFGSNFAMFAFYIRNNVGIDFRTFAGGILGGVGSLFFVTFNGLAIGAATGYVIQEADGGKFLNWVSGHSGPEFLGLLFSGVAGLRLGFGLIHPGRLSRRASLIAAGKKAIVLLYGAAILTVLAAVIEGFWSPMAFPEPIKYAFGLALTSVLVAYLFLAGRRRDAT